MTKFELTSFYIPPNCLNEEEFPGHILWNGECSVIELTLEPNIEFMDVYNCKREVTNDGKIRLTNIGVSGYAGLKFKAKIGREIDINSTISCNFYDSAGQFIREESRVIHVFRPNIERITKPDNMQVIFDIESQKYQIKDKITLANKGKGTALVFLGVESDDDGIRLSLPPRIKEFIDSLNHDIKIRFQDLSRNYKEYSKQLWQYYRVSLNAPTLILEKKGDIILSANLALNNILRDDEGFRQEYEKEMLVVYLKNIPLVAEVSSFVDYLNSIGKGRVMLLNSIWHLTSDKESGIARLKLLVLDLGMHSYGVKSLGTINIKFTQTKTVPIYLLFNWSDKNGD